MYDIKFNNASATFIKKIKDKKLKEKYKIAIEKISENPFIGIPKKGDLSGIYGYDIYYNKTNYEIAYKIYQDDQNLVVVILAGTRENFYEQLKRYIF